jgi:hypothetical protein
MQRFEDGSLMVRTGRGMANCTRRWEVHWAYFLAKDPMVALLAQKWDTRYVNVVIFVSEIMQHP